jgi:hypothetical protein
MTRRPAPLPSLLGLLAALAGCAGSGSYPSLAQRPIEKTLGEPREEPPAPAPPADDPAVAARAAEFLAQARQGMNAFEAALRPADAAARRAGAPGSDSWIEAQQAISRAQAAASGTGRALADLDRYAVDAGQAKALSPNDLAALKGATDAIQALADRQRREVERLQGMLRTR